MKLVFYTLLFTSAILSSCGSFKNTNKDVAESITSGTWTLKEVMTGAFSVSDFRDNIPNLNFGTDGNFSGFDGCNSMRSNYTIDGAKLNLGNIAATRKFCQDVKDEEFQALLKEANSFTIKKGELTLLNGAKALMKFAKQ